MSVIIREDRSMCVQPNQSVKVDWVDIDVCRMRCRDRMSPEAVKEKWVRMLNNGEAACWPPIVGHWEGGAFVISDGRHEFIASLMMGRTRVLAAWLIEAQPK